MNATQGEGEISNEQSVRTWAAAHAHPSCRERAFNTGVAGEKKTARRQPKRSVHWSVRHLLAGVALSCSCGALAQAASGHDQRPAEPHPGGFAGAEIWRLPSRSGAGSKLRFVRLSNGDGIALRCRSNASDCFTTSRGGFELRLLSSGAEVTTRASLEKVLEGRVTISRGSKVIGTTVPLDQTPTSIRLGGVEIANVDLFETKRYPGCLGGVAPQQFFIGNSRFAIFRISQTSRTLESKVTCVLPEKPGVVRTDVRQELPEIFHAFQSSDGYWFFPLEEGDALKFQPGALRTGYVGADLYILKMSTWDEQEWRTLPSLLNEQVGQPVNFQVVYDRLRQKLKGMKGPNK